jgi:hypothetical protein
LSALENSSIGGPACEKFGQSHRFPRRGEPSNLKSELAIAAPLLLSRKINDLEAQLALFCEQT